MKKSWFSKLNNRLGKLSHTALILILVIYSCVLGGIYALVTLTRSYLVVPNYEHVYWDEEVNPQITIIGRRTFDSDNKMSLKYSVNVSVYGRISPASTTDPGYALTDFKMSAATVTSTTSKNPANMYFFTEYKTYTTPTTHYFTLDNSSVDQHPYELYTMIQHKKGGKTKISTYKEDVFLYPDSNDITKIDDYFSAPASADATSRNIKKGDEQIANIQFIASNQSEYYSGGVKITMDKLGATYKHHIDMQSWILTSDGKYLPFVGVYSYSQQKTNYSQSGISIYKQLNPQYIVAKLRYYFSETEYQDYYFKQAFDKLPTSFQSSPNAADEIEDNKTINKGLVIGISIGAAVLVCAIILPLTVVYINKKKKNKETNSLPENETSDSPNQE